MTSRRDRRARSRAHEAEFTAFAREAQPCLLRTAWLLSGGASTADDVVRGALVSTYLVWPRVGEAAAYIHALRVVATAAVPSWSGTAVGGAPSSVAPEAHAETLRWLAALPTRQRQVVVLRTVADLSEADTAHVLGTDDAEIDAAWSGAQAALRQVLLAGRSQLGGFTRPTGASSSSHVPQELPADTTAAALEPPADLRRRLEAVLPAGAEPAQGAADLATALRRGRGIARRRRLGAALAVAAAVALLAVAVAAVTRGHVWDQPVPVSAYGPAGSVVLEVPGPIRPDGGSTGPVTYAVGIGPVDTAGRRTVRCTVPGAAAAVGTLDEHHRTLVRAGGAGAELILGVIPSGGAQDQLFAEYGDGVGGSYSSTVERIPGTDYSAFALALDHPADADPAVVKELLWFDESGHPVDETGRVGGAATIGTTRVWVSPDQTFWSVDGSTNFTGPDILDTVSTSEGSGPVLVGLVRQEITTASRIRAVLNDGSEHEVTPVSVGPYRVFTLEVATDSGSQRLSLIRWTDASGAPHDAPIFRGG